MHNGNIEAGKTVYNTYSVHSKNGNESVVNDIGDKTINNIILRKHSASTKSNKTRKLRKNTFRKSKKSYKKKNSKIVRKKNRLNKSKINRKMSKYRSGKSRTSKRTLNGKKINL